MFLYNGNGSQARTFAARAWLLMLVITELIDVSNSIEHLTADLDRHKVILLLP